MIALKNKDLSISLYESLKNDPFFYYLKNIIIGDEKKKERTMLEYMDYSIHEANTYGKIGTHDNENYGASLWVTPLNSDLYSLRKTEKTAQMISIFGSDVYAKINLVGEFMNSQNSKHISNDMWYLSILGVNPAYQNQGLGKKLVEPVLIEADKLQVATYLETFTLQNNSFYKRLGYEIITSIKTPSINQEYNLMIRKPK